MRLPCIRSWQQTFNFENEERLKNFVIKYLNYEFLKGLDILSLNETHCNMPSGETCSLEVTFSPEHFITQNNLYGNLYQIILDYIVENKPENVNIVKLVALTKEVYRIEYQIICNCDPKDFCSVKTIL